MIVERLSTYSILHEYCVWCVVVYFSWYAFSIGLCVLYFVVSKQRSRVLWSYWVYVIFHHHKRFLYSRLHFFCISILYALYIIFPSYHFRYFLDKLRDRHCRLFIKCLYILQHSPLRTITNQHQLSSRHHTNGFYFIWKYSCTMVLRQLNIDSRLCLLRFLYHSLISIFNFTYQVESHKVSLSKQQLPLSIQINSPLISSSNISYIFCRKSSSCF